MRRLFGHIAVIVLALLSLMGCHRKGRVISAGTLEDIYVDMFIADQWIKSNPDARPKADTTLFYEPIFRRYGYSTADYDATVSYYIDRPDKYVKILRRAAKTLNLKQLEYAKVAERINRVKNQDREGFGYMVSDFLNADSILSGSLVLDSLLVRDSVFIKAPAPSTPAPADSLKSEGDSLTIDNKAADDKGRDRIRPHKKPAPRELPGDKLIADPGEAM